MYFSLAIFTYELMHGIVLHDMAHYYMILQWDVCPRSVSLINNGNAVVHNGSCHDQFLIFPVHISVICSTFSHRALDNIMQFC